MDCNQTTAPRSFCFAALILFIFAVTSSWADIINFHWRNPLPQGNPLRYLANGNGISVVPAGGSQLITSTNGTAWDYRRIEIPGQAVSFGPITFADGYFFSLGTNVVYKSSNGIEWEATPVEATMPLLRDLTYANGTFVAVGMAKVLVPAGVWLDRNKFGISCF